MVWKFDQNDRISTKQLLGFKKFFIQDVTSAVESVNQAERYKKYGLPNWRTEIIKRNLAVVEALKNLQLVNEALVLAEKRGL